MQNRASSDFRLTLRQGEFTCYLNNLKDMAGFIVYISYRYQIP